MVEATSAFERAIRAEYAPLLAAATETITVLDDWVKMLAVTPWDTGTLRAEAKRLRAILDRLRSGEGGEPKQEVGS